MRSTGSRSVLTFLCLRIKLPLMGLSIHRICHTTQQNSVTIILYCFEYLLYTYLQRERERVTPNRNGDQIRGDVNVVLAK